MTSNAIATLARDVRVESIVCLGTGGVGKTTTAAAIGSYAASQGRPTLVVTVDPAARLSQIMGASTSGANEAELALEPHSVSGMPGLSMVQLNTSAVFDAAVRDALPSAQAQSLTANSYYRLIADAFAGSADYMAAELVGRLRTRIAATGELLIVDTSPAASAFEFLDAPSRLAAFTDSRFVRTLQGIGGQGRGSLLTRTLLSSVLGSQLTDGVAELLSSLQTALVDMRDRATSTFEHLTSAASAFVLITRPSADQLDPVRHAAINLRSRGYQLSACVINQMPMNHSVHMDDSQLRDIIRGVEALADSSASDVADALRLLLEQRRVAVVAEALANSLATASGATGVHIHRARGLTDCTTLAALIASAH